MVALLALGMAGQRGPKTAQWATAELVRTFDARMKTQGFATAFDRYQAYSAKLLDDSAGTNIFRDKTGNCRLSWFDGLMRQQKTAPLEAEDFSRELHQSAGCVPDGVTTALRMMFDKIDVREPAARPVKPDQLAGLSLITNNLAGLHLGIEQAFKPLTPPERLALLHLIVAQTLTTNAPGHRFEQLLGGRLVCNIMERLNRAGFRNAGLQAAGLADAWAQGRLDSWMDAIAQQPCTSVVAGVTGPVAAVIPTATGLIVVGGTNANQYALDENLAIVMVVDLGGDDTYLEGTLSEARTVLVLLDRSGNDRYAGQKTGIQGGAIGGVSLLLDGAGNDSYEAVYLAQGACLAGVGMLIDAGGDDRYTADQRAQGHGIGGVGVLIDRAGNDSYHGAMLVQGVGGPLGFGLLEDAAGADSYYAGGKYGGGYDDTPGFGGWSQGVGIGPRGVANGGVGVLLDGGGDDVYEYDYFSHGGGYWFAVGIARDFGGNDQRVGATRTNWDGSVRNEKRFVRWGPAYGCHYAMGFLFDDAGNDLYSGNHAGVGFSWDIALSVLVDAAGDDVYDETGSGIGQAHQVCMALLVDGGGNDTYKGGAPGQASAKAEYHATMTNQSNFALALDLGGQDKWSCGLSNGTTRVQGWAGGAVIDR